MRMKKLSFILSLIVFGQLAFGQAVHDRNVIPVAVNLNQVLRMTITNGGNIEFVFNTIDDYQWGISGGSSTLAGAQGTGVDAAGPPPTTASANQAPSDPMYVTNFSVSSSTRWLLNYGAENSEFMGTDNAANRLALNNVGFFLTESGVHDFETGGAKATTAGEQLWSTPTNSATEVSALQAYPVLLIEDNDQVGNDEANAGDALDNLFSLTWRCGTQEATGLTTPMNQVSILDQGDIDPDRYVVNVLFELGTDF